MGKFRDDDGWRSNVSKQIVYKLAVSKGLEVEAQVQSWVRNNEFGSSSRYGDFVTILRKN